MHRVFGKPNSTSMCLCVCVCSTKNGMNEKLGFAVATKTFLSSLVEGILIHL